MKSCPTARAEVRAAGVGPLADGGAVTQHHRREFVRLRRSDVALDAGELDFEAFHDHAADTVGEPAGGILLEHAEHQAVAGGGDRLGPSARPHLRLAGEDVAPEPKHGRARLAAEVQLDVLEFLPLLQHEPDLGVGGHPHLLGTVLLLAVRRRLVERVADRLRRAVEHHALAVGRGLGAAAVPELDFLDEVGERFGGVGDGREAEPGQDQQDACEGHSGNFRGAGRG
jgi:hypothetical protein